MAGADTAFSFETTLTADRVDQLLSDACLHKYKVAYKHLGVSENGAHKQVTVRFATITDAQRFRSAMQGGRPAASKPKKRGLLSVFGLG